VPEPHQPATSARTAALAGARTIAPLAVAVFPFGLVYGVLVAQSSVPDWVGGLASILVIAGASQIALVDLIDRDAPFLVAVATALIINLRMVLYSAALAPAYSAFSRTWRYGLASVIVDQTTVTALAYFEREKDPRARRWWIVGASALFIGSWVLGTWTGIVSGAGIPDGIELGFAIPLTFLALLVPALKGRPDVAAAVIATVAVVVAAPLPFSLGLPIGAAVGVASGMAVPR
jgi:predicted branched-subunit amino acid permease